MLAQSCQHYTIAVVVVDSAVGLLQNRTAGERVAGYKTGVCAPHAQNLLANLQDIADEGRLKVHCTVVRPVLMHHHFTVNGKHPTVAPPK